MGYDHRPDGDPVARDRLDAGDGQAASEVVHRGTECHRGSVAQWAKVGHLDRCRSERRLDAIGHHRHREVVDKVKGDAAVQTAEWVDYWARTSSAISDGETCSYATSVTVVGTPG